MTRSTFASGTFSASRRTSSGRLSVAWRRITGGTTPANDDQFDAAVDYILGRAYAAGGETGIGRVSIHGHRRTGSFLLPDTPDLRARWGHWLSTKAM